MQFTTPTDVPDEHPNHLILVAPADVELPSGFPFKKVTGTVRERLLAAFTSTEPVVLPIDPDMLGNLRSIAPAMELEIKHLQHTVGGYSSYWHMQAKPFPTLSVNEIMETREARNPGTPPTLSKEDVASYSHLLTTLQDAGKTKEESDSE